MLSEEWRWVKRAQSSRDKLLSYLNFFKLLKKDFYKKEIFATLKELTFLPSLSHSLWFFASYHLSNVVVCYVS